MADHPPRLTVANHELVTVRDAMREMNRMVDRFGDPHNVEKFVLMRGTQMVAVILPLEGYADLTRPTDFAKAWVAAGRLPCDHPPTPERTAMTFLEVLEALDNMYVRMRDEADWIHDLKSALLKIAYNADMPQAEKDQESARLVESVMGSLRDSNDAAQAIVYRVLDAAQAEENYFAKAGS